MDVLALLWQIYSRRCSVQIHGLRWGGGLPPIRQRLLEWLLGRRTNALTNFFANLGIVLCHLQNGVVFLQREALISHCVRQGIDGLKRSALLVGGGRRGYPLSIILLETGHPLYGGCHRLELLVRNIRRLVGETGHRIEL